jgi:hypothetical protein
VIDRHVLGRREAVVDLDGVEREDIRQPRAAQRILDRAADVGEDVGRVAAGGELVVERDRCGPMAEPAQVRNGVERDARDCCPTMQVTPMRSKFPESFPAGRS